MKIIDDPHTQVLLTITSAMGIVMRNYRPPGDVFCEDYFYCVHEVLQGDSMRKAEI